MQTFDYIWSLKFPLLISLEVMKSYLRIWAFKRFVLSTLKYPKKTLIAGASMEVNVYKSIHSQRAGTQEKQAMKSLGWPGCFEKHFQAKSLTEEPIKIVTILATSKSWTQHFSRAFLSC